MLGEEDILAILQSELSNSDHLMSTVDFRSPLDYYLGNPNGREQEGRSQVISTDVADAVEWIMPQIMKSFTQNNEIVIFDPIKPGDEKQAELESEYVYEVLMKQNDGFIILHQFVKDALLQKNGLLKVYYCEKDKVKIVELTGYSQEQCEQILANPEIELLERTDYVDEAKTAEMQAIAEQQMQQLSQLAEQGQDVSQQIQMVQQNAQQQFMLCDVKIAVTRTQGQIYIDPVPPEDFRVNNGHSSLALDNARFTSHVTEQTVSELMQQYDLSFEEAKDLPTSNEYDRKEYRFTAQNETLDYDDSDDDSQRKITVSESYLQIDIDEVGISKLMKITAVGGTTPTKIIHQEEIDEMPWISTTAILMSHKFYGQSIYDRLKMIQDQKTTLWRNMFDNLYFQNNQRIGVVEGMVNMDDLMVSRPGGLVRIKRPDALVPIQTPALTGDAYNMMDMLDRVRAGRVGVDPDGNATPQNIGDRVGSQGVDRLMNAKEELVGLIIRVIAETGVKPLCVKIRDLSIKHIDAVHDFQFRGVWQQINPSKWMDRTKCTVRVGTGTGNHSAKVAALNTVMAIQKELAVNGSTLVDEITGYSALDDFCKFSGLNGAERYFVDPNSPKGQQAKQQSEQMQQQNQQQQQQMQTQMAQAQTQIAQAETMKAQAQQAKVNVEAQLKQVQNQLTMQKQQSDSVVSQLELQLTQAKEAAKAAGDESDRVLKKYDIDVRTALELTKLEATSQKEQSEEFNDELGEVMSGNVMPGDNDDRR